VLATNTTEVHLEDVRVPLENKLGSDTTGGMMGVVATLESSRVMVAAAALGIARAAFETALAYAKTRVQKKPIIEFQAVGHKLADLETQPNFKASNLFRTMVYGDHPYGRPSMGSKKTVEKLSAADCKAFHKAAFMPNATTVVAVGNLAEAISQPLRNQVAKCPHFSLSQSSA
jgi:zinc protease